MSFYFYQGRRKLNGKKVDAQMATEIALNTLGASESLANLTKAVSAATKAWKAQEVALRVNGEYTEAAKIKYEGLSNVIDRQEQKIVKIKEKQKELNVETVEGAKAHLKYQQELENAETKLTKLTAEQKKAKQAYDLQKSGIIDLNKQLQLSEQVSHSFVERLKAEGRELEANQEKIRFLTDKIKSLQEIQEKENNILEKIRSNSGEASEAYKKQAIRVNDLGTEIAHTRTKVNDLGNKIVYTNTELKKFRETGKKKISLNLDGAISKLEKLNEKTEKSHHLFGKLIGAQLISNAAIGGVRSLVSYLREATQAGIEFTKEQQVMSKAWETLTNDAQKAKEMVETINQISVATGRSVDLVNELEQGFYHLHSNKEESDQLTKAMLNMGDAVGLSDEQINRVTQDMVHGLATGKANLKEVNQLSQYFPMFSEKLAASLEEQAKASQKAKNDAKEAKVEQKAATKAQTEYRKEMTAQFEAMHYGNKITSDDLQQLADKGIITVDQMKKFQEMQNSNQKVTTGLIKQEIRVNSQYASSSTKTAKQVSEQSENAVAMMRDMVSHGEVSAEQVQKIFLDLGLNVYGKAAENMLDTISGMHRIIKARVPALVSDFVNPIINAENPFYKTISNWVADKKTDEKFKEMGVAAQQGIDTILKAFGKVFQKGSSVDLANQSVDWLTQKIKEGSNWIANHAESIVTFFRNTRDVAIDLFDRGKQTLEGFYQIAVPFLDVVKKYPKQVGEITAALWLAKPAIGGVTLALEGFKIVKDISGWLDTLLQKLKILSEEKVISPQIQTPEMSAVGQVPSASLTKGIVNERLEAEGVAKSTGVASKFKLFGKLGKGAPILAGLSSLLELQGMTKNTAGQHVGAAIGNFGGAMAGATIGSAILPGIGTIAGGILGALGGEKIGQSLGKKIQQGLQDYFGKKDSGTPIRDSFSKGVSGIYSDLDAEYIKIGTRTDGFTTDEQKKIDGMYQELSKKTDKYFADKQKNSKKDLDVLVKNGVLTQEQADKMLKQEKAKDNDHANAVKEAYQNQRKLSKNYYEDYNKLVKAQKEVEQNTLSKYEKKYGKNSKEYNKKKRQIEQDNQKALNKLHENYFTALQKEQSKVYDTLNTNIQTKEKTQRNILEDLRKQKKKISEQEATDMIQQSTKAKRSIIADADETYEKTKKAANKKYDEIVAAAKKERDESGTITDEQYKEIVKNAGKERDDTINAAKEKHDETVKHATEQHNEVVNQATKQANEHKDEINTETGYALNSWSQFNIDLAHIVNALTGGINAILGFFNDKWKHAIPEWKPKGYATGTKGILQDEIAVVGEEGFELAHHRNKGIFPVGLAGQELRYLEKGTSILPHSQSKKFLSMVSQLPHHKTGILGTITNMFDWVKGKFSGVWDVVSKGATGVIDDVVDSLGFNKFAKNLTNDVFKNLSKGSFSKIKSTAIDYMKGLIDKFTSENSIDSFNGPIGAHGVYQYLVDIAQKVMAKFPGMHITSGYRPGDPYWHGKHQAIDIAYPSSMNGSSKYFDPANYAFSFPNVAYVITQGKVRDRLGLSGQPATGQWEPWPDNDHYDHLHINGALGGMSIFKGGSISRSAESWRNQVIAAAKLVGFPTDKAHIDRIIRQIQTESGGNERAVQGGYTDINTITGDLAKGLMQTISATFNTYKLPGHGNIFNGYDNILAGLRYIMARYGTGAGFFANIGMGHGYANGGMISKHGWYEISENDKKEMVIPMDIMKRSRGWQLVGEVVNHFVQDDPSFVKPAVQHANVEVKELNHKFDILLNMFGQLLGINANQLEAIKAGSFDKEKFYKQQAIDQSLYNHQVW